MNHSCHLCGKDKAELLLDFGTQPVCNRFLTENDENETSYPLQLGQCRACGLIQLQKPLKPADVRPRFDWIRYREPEDHLADVAQMIEALDGISPEAAIFGLSGYDTPLIERLAQKGFSFAQVMAPDSDYKIRQDTWGVETIIDKLAAGASETIVDEKGRLDIIIAGFILEHAWHVRDFLKSIRTMIKPSGYFILQVPDFGEALKVPDYSSIWEEHVLYFTEDSLRACALACGFEPVLFKAYDSQSVLTAVWRLADKEKTSLEVDPGHQLVLGNDYKNSFCRLKADIQMRLERFREKRGRVAVFGAGHQTCQFINLFDIGGMIDFVADDFKPKQGLYMPGSRLEIKSSENLVTENISLCLLGVSPGICDRIISNNRQFIENGGVFGSIYQEGFEIE